MKPRRRALLVAIFATLGLVGFVGAPRVASAAPCVPLATHGAAPTAVSAASEPPYGNNVVYGKPTSSVLASVDTCLGTASGVFFVDGGVRLFAEEQDQGTWYTDTKGDQGTICTTSNGVRTDAYTYHSLGYFKTNLGVLYWTKDPPLDPSYFVDYKGLPYDIVGAINPHS